MRDLTNQRFGRHIAIKQVGVNKWRNCLWLCRCDCGKEHVVSSGKLIQGKSKSCGCLAHDVRVEQLEKHGITTGGKPRTFIIWNGMKARCYNKKATSYKTYGAKGIEICDEWLRFENFHNWAISNGYKDNYEIDRIDGYGNYEPDNCQWISKTENRRKQRHMRIIEIYEEKHNVAEWCRLLKMSKRTAYKYLNKSDKDFVEYAKGQQYFVNKLLNENK
ncbi:hypothetical protein [Enterococcus wangshanyuanii]|uniref:AP2 domain-containing protein n=1 Tax=Enterococcus wangshanyuanii TaxID=2005703 RepID=A0ABQ1PVH9_9ENTE|nr:hypothetical protein [Enterococcus wangshanyuanii]GGD04882.1 hypothetical protein GCM10011573_37970 [Enterococcus wangshanyuanii]